MMVQGNCSQGSLFRQREWVTGCKPASGNKLSEFHTVAVQGKTEMFVV